MRRPNTRILNYNRSAVIIIPITIYECVYVMIVGNSYSAIAHQCDDSPIFIAAGCALRRRAGKVQRNRYDVSVVYLNARRD